MWPEVAQLNRADGLLLSRLDSPVLKFDSVQTVIHISSQVTYRCCIC